MFLLFVPPGTKKFLKNIYFKTLELYHLEHFSSLSFENFDVNDRALLCNTGRTNLDTQNMIFRTLS